MSLPPAAGGRVRIRARPWRPAWAAALLLQLACQAPPTAAPPAAAASARPAAAETEARQGPASRAVPSPASDAGRYDLERDEARGGHTLARHVGKSDAELRERLRRERDIGAASTYPDRETAERVVARTLARQRTRVDQWLGRTGPRPNLALDYRGGAGETIGRSLTRRSDQTLPCTDALVVLRWDGRRGFVVLTSYPEIKR